MSHHIAVVSFSCFLIPTMVDMVLLIPTKENYFMQSKCQSNRINAKETGFSEQIYILLIRKILK